MLKQERAVRTLRSLIHSAAETFLRHGYVQAKLAEISTGAGVSTGALHFHFETKAALASTVQDAAAAILRTAARSAASQPGTNALQTLTNTSHVLADTLRDDVVARAGFQLSRDARCETEWDVCQEWREYVQRLLTQAADEGVLVEDAVPDDVAASIVATTTGLELLARDDAGWLSHTTLTDFWTLVLPALATPAALAVLEPAGTHSGGRDRTPPGGHGPVRRAQLTARRPGLSTRPVPIH
ncbi:ScbR family autoregulator-binding transcription factor [Streptomyces sp. NBC_00212]|uniref:ScbR family autoregulator-binding transcription factor n=1 Tax=Streptomyces sp. NBC_00212 TaxID=2975684 RepID=UPI002F912395